MSIFKPEGSVVAGAAVAALVYATYSQAVPTTAVMHATQPHDTNIEAGRKKAAWTSAAVVGGISLIARDPTIFVLGGMVLIALDWHARHANSVSPTGELVSMQGGYEPARSPLSLADAG